MPTLARKLNAKLAKGNEGVPPTMDEEMTFVLNHLNLGENITEFQRQAIFTVDALKALRADDIAKFTRLPLGDATRLLRDLSATQAAFREKRAEMDRDLVASLGSRDQAPVRIGAEG
jgi:hypothetical protein